MRHRRGGLKLYEKLVEDIEGLIASGVLLPGDRIPSVRHTSRQHKLSITTVLKAYLLLESKGAVESRPQSGYFVRKLPENIAPSLGIQPSHPVAVPAEVDVSRLVLSTLRSIRGNDAVPLGSPYPDPSLFPLERVNRYNNLAMRNHRSGNLLDDLPPGNEHLIREIARRYLENGLALDPQEIVITVGATEAINLCLQAVARPGDTIAVESPTFYAMLHAIERMGMRAIEISTDPYEGISIESLQKIVAGQPIAAVMVMPNFQNPLGFQMSDERKKTLVDFLAQHDIPAIENGVYNELYFGESHPSSLKSFDRKGLVLHCSSFSKSLSPVLRIGWALTGRYKTRVEELKFLNTLTTSSIPQLAIAEYLKHDGFDHHLRRIRKAYAQQANIMAAAIRRFFPAETRVSHPMGGYVLWVELPDHIDSMKLYQRALECNITIGPGRMFSVGNAYKHCIRLNYSYPWSAEIEHAIAKLGKLISEFPAPRK
jgi:DNA-binding transcriptional MocR family regulator